jgi:hypothetical protein
VLLAVAAGLIAPHARLPDAGQGVEVAVEYPASGCASGAADAAREALSILAAWLRPFPFERLVLDEVPWFHPHVGRVSAGRVVIPARCVLGGGAGGRVRVIYHGIARLFWPLPPDSSDRGWFVDGIAQFLAVRALQSRASGAPPYDQRLFGGWVPYEIASFSMARDPAERQPPIRRLNGLPSDARSARIVDALYTLERLIGWPAVQQALSASIRREDAARLTPAVLGAIVEEQTGRVLTSYFSRAFIANESFDFAIASFSSAPTDRAELRFDSTVGVTRPAEVQVPVDVVVGFGDGSELRERWRGGGATIVYRYASRTRAFYAVVDPERLLLLDERRGNNRAALQPASIPVPMRWLLQWAIWLQDAMLAYSAVL